MRREKCPRIPHSDTALGSPPHAQGKALLNGGIKAETRITPACAGKSGQISERAIFD